jgi:hypothetical protein
VKITSRVPAAKLFQTKANIKTRCQSRARANGRSPPSQSHPGERHSDDVVQRPRDLISSQLSMVTPPRIGYRALATGRTDPHQVAIGRPANGVSKMGSFRWAPKACVTQQLNFGKIVGTPVLQPEVSTALGCNVDRAHLVPQVFRENAARGKYGVGRHFDRQLRYRRSPFSGRKTPFSTKLRPAISVGQGRTRLCSCRVPKKVPLANIFANAAFYEPFGLPRCKSTRAEICAPACRLAVSLRLKLQSRKICVRLLRRLYEARDLA